MSPSSILYPSYFPTFHQMNSPFWLVFTHWLNKTYQTRYTKTKWFHSHNWHSTEYVLWVCLIGNALSKAKTHNNSNIVCHRHMCEITIAALRKFFLIAPIKSIFMSWKIVLKCGRPCIFVYVSNKTNKTEKTSLASSLPKKKCSILIKITIKRVPAQKICMILSQRLKPTHKRISIENVTVRVWHTLYGISTASILNNDDVKQSHGDFKSHHAPISLH